MFIKNILSNFSEFSFETEELKINRFFIFLITLTFVTKKFRHYIYLYFLVDILNTIYNVFFLGLFYASIFEIFLFFHWLKKDNLKID